ncbi:MAG TPA: response regulator [Pirellulales bacterium]|nr:response regulator [Pirellulales bacterium]
MITHLLVADSDPFLLESCSDYFCNRGYRVAAAANALECIEALRLLPPDVLILEQELIWGGGDGVMACLREDHFRWPETVIMTTSAPAGQPSRPLDPPLKALVHKPCSPATLCEVIRQVHCSQTQLTPRFLHHSRGIAAQEQRRRDRGPMYPLRPRFPDNV